MRNIAVKSIEVNIEKGLKTRHFRELGVLFWFLDCFISVCLLSGKIKG